jgi:hypothetical protein
VRPPAEPRLAGESPTGAAKTGQNRSRRPGSPAPAPAPAPAPKTPRSPQTVAPDCRSPEALGVRPEAPAPHPKRKGRAPAELSAPGKTGKNRQKPAVTSNPAQSKIGNRKSEIQSRPPAAVRPAVTAARPTARPAVSAARARALATPARPAAPAPAPKGVRGKAVAAS